MHPLGCDPACDIEPGGVAGNGEYGRIRIWHLETCECMMLRSWFLTALDFLKGFWFCLFVNNISIYIVLSSLYCWTKGPGKLCTRSREGWRARKFPFFFPLSSWHCVVRQQGSKQGCKKGRKGKQRRNEARKQSSKQGMKREQEAWNPSFTISKQKSFQVPGWRLQDTRVIIDFESHVGHILPYSSCG